MERKIREIWIQFRLWRHIIPWCRRTNDFPGQDSPPFVQEMETGPDSKISRVKKNHLDTQLILSIFRQPLHVSGLSRPIIRRYNRVYTTIGTYYSFIIIFRFQSDQDNRQSSKKNNKYQLLYTYGVPPDDGRRYSRNVEVDDIYIY